MINEIFFRAEKYYLSYNPDCFDTGLSETAICIGPGINIGDTKYLILNGDHREAMKDLDLEGLKKYFLEHQDQKGYTSDSI